MDRPLFEFERLLDEERAALRAGHLEAIRGFSERRDALLGRVSAAGADPGELQRVQEKIRRNSVLLDAVRGGINAAIRRINEVQKATGPIASYGANGDRREIGRSRPNWEHKA